MQPTHRISRDMSRAKNRRSRQARSRAAAARRLLGRDAAAVRLGDLAHDREAEPGTGQRARRRGAVEAVEDVLAVLGRDARAVVAHAQLAARERDVDARAGAASTCRRSRAGSTRRARAAPATPSTVVGSMWALKCTFGKRARARSTALSTISSSCTAARSRFASPRASSSSPVIRSRISCASRSRSAKRRARCSGSSRSCCFSTSMFVCRLVSGVRSSCEASATNRRCVSIDSSSAASIVLNAVPSRASSSWPPARVDALARVARLRDPLRRRGEPAHRDERRARDECAAGRAAAIPPPTTRSRINSSRCERAVDVVEGATTLQRDPRPSASCRRSGVDPRMHPADGRVA